MSSFTISTEQQHYIAGNVAPSTDRDGQHQVDPAGIPLWEIRVVSIPEPEPGRDRVPMPEVIRVTVPAAAAPELRFGAPVVFEALTVRTWSARDGRAGLMYGAAAVRVRQPHAEPPAKPPAQATEPAR